VNTPVSTSGSDFGYAQPRPKRVLWKWSLAVTAVLLIWFAWQCGSALYQGRALANAAVNEFHQRLNDAKFDEICDKADAGFTKAGQREDMVKLLAAVHSKLGNAGAENLASLRVNATPSETLLIAEYNTQFERGSAVETFTWVKSTGALRLRGYNINSNALILN
jgi:hypothetical protein